MLTYKQHLESFAGTKISLCQFVSLTWSNFPVWICFKILCCEKVHRKPYWIVTWLLVAWNYEEDAVRSENCFQVLVGKGKKKKNYFYCSKSIKFQHFSINPHIKKLKECCYFSHSMMDSDLNWRLVKCPNNLNI